MLPLLLKNLGFSICRGPVPRLCLVAAAVASLLACCAARAEIAATTAASAPATTPASAASTQPASEPLYDRFGGNTLIKGDKTGYFHLQKVGKRWMWITPNGNGMVALGVSGVTMEGPDWNGADRDGKSHRDYCLKKYGKLENWQKATARRLADWGFNYTGAYSAGSLASMNVPYIWNTQPVTGAVDSRWAVAGNIWCGSGRNYIIPDVYNPAVEKYAAETMEAARQQHKDPLLLCYLVDDPDQLKGLGVGQGHLGLAVLCSAMEIGPSATARADGKKFPNFAKQAMIDRLKAKYETVEKLNDAWGTQFESFDAIKDVRYDRSTWGDWGNPQRKDHPAFRADLDAATQEFACRYCSIVRQAVRKSDTSHAIAFSIQEAKALDAAARGFAQAGNFDLYFFGGDGKEYEKLGRPFMRQLYLHANADSPLRFQGRIDRWVVTADPEGKKPDPQGKFLKCYDDRADLWFKLKFAGASLPVTIKGLPLGRSVARPGEGQVLYTGKDEDGHSWFTVRPTAAYFTGSLEEWLAAMGQLKSKDMSIAYVRGSARPQWSFATQGQRGQAWADNVKHLVEFTAPGGDYYIVGLEQWRWMDNGWTYWMEQVNFGLVTLKDNAYDGKEATRAGADGSAGAGDDEQDDYGDCIGPIRKANLAVYEEILKKGQLD